MGSAERLRIGLNLCFLRPGIVGGTEQYATRLIRSVAEHHRDRVEMVIFGLPALIRAHPELSELAEVHPAPISGDRRPVRVAAESSWLAAAARRSRVQLVHHLGGTVPLVRSVPAAVTIHDVQYLTHPENFSPVKRRYLARQVPAALRAARGVSTVSGYARDSLVAHFGLAPAAVAVVPHPVPRLPVGRIELPPRPFVLYPAMSHAHKNHRVVLEALAGQDPDRQVDLVLTGGRGDAHAQLMADIERLGLTERVEHRGRVGEAELGALYRAAIGLVFPSVYEGFGAPVVEAMAMGCPVAAADRTALPELVGSAGVLVAAEDPAAWARAIERLISDRDALLAAGHRRAADFGPEAAADRLVRWWAELVGA